MFDVLRTWIDGLDAVLAGGIRYPEDGAAFVFISGGPGSGKTLLGLEMVARQWLEGEDGSTCLYYSVEHTPQSLARKLAFDFGFYGSASKVTTLPQEVPHKLVLLAETARGRSKLVLTQAHPATFDEGRSGSSVDIDWILAEIANHRLAGPVKIACVDNIGLLLTDLDFFGKRRALLATRRQLQASKVHGIFVQETTDTRDLRLPSAEEFSTDLLIELGYQRESQAFKARTLEIQKARHQYYYRGVHHFSIAGRGVLRDSYLGARNERGPGVHVYPSVAAQLSISRDTHGGTVPPRGRETLDMGQRDLASGFLDGTGPTSGSSTVILAEPGTRYTYLAMRFLAAGCALDEQTLFVSTKEDSDALLRIAEREPALSRDLLRDGKFVDRFRVLYLHPEFISAGKFTWDLLRFTEAEGGQPVTRLAFDNIYRLGDRFPLLESQEFMIPALLDVLRYRGVTPLFVDLVPPGSAKGRVPFDPARWMVTFDHVLHLFLDEEERTPRTYVRVLKSSTGKFARRAMPVDFDRE
ncbi:MAG: ATPase domain-containing protein [Planctomycetota bacterium]